MLKKKISADTTEDNEENEEKKQVSQEKTKREDIGIINQEIEEIDIKDFVGVKFFINNGDIFSIKAKNLIKVVLLVTEKMGKTSFEKNELKEVYNFIIQNYKTKLSPTQFKRITDIIEQFVVE